LISDSKTISADPAANLKAVLARIAAAKDAAISLGPTLSSLPSAKATAGAHSAVLQAGHRLFGENRVQEAKAKWPPLRAQFPESELHLIGPLQSNKSARRLPFSIAFSRWTARVGRGVKAEMEKTGGVFPFSSR
jgi:uncharacterized pyridoxal phosphate-containing UPF0001 family protein